ncbi:MAG: ABC transporter ATP-binding protein [Anaerolineales bacterium]|nr:ABC transporter ATP-binding protein [Anaerolineales bacterium]
MLELKNISKKYEDEILLNGVSFAVGEGETVCLLGASGSGKSTLLRIIAGLDIPEAGCVYWDNRDLADVPVHHRNFGLVFQDYALFPHLTVAGNIAFGLKMQGLGDQETNRRVEQALRQVSLAGFGGRRVNDLSGGEQQRVALARALAPGPRLMMFDEPLGALDRTLRDLLITELRQILHSTGIPAIYVTHDQEEAATIADRILLLNEGQIVQDGAPQEIYSRPASAWVARFLGLGSVLDGTVTQTGQVETKAGMLEATCLHRHVPGQAVSILIRPGQNRPEAGGSKISGRVSDVVFHQEQFRVTLENGLYFYWHEAPQLGEVLEVPVVGECLG